MRNGLAYRVSLGGVISSLCVFFMFCSNLFPMLNYTIPTFAGFLMVVMIVETNAVWAFTTYAAVSILSFLVTPNLEAAMLFTLFMGYYPILRVYLQKVTKPVLRLTIKLLVFNAAVFVFYILFQYVFMTEDMLEGLERFGKYAGAVLLVGANMFFIVYDRLVGQLTDLYINWFRKKILKRK